MRISLRALLLGLALTGAAHAQICQSNGSGAEIICTWQGGATEVIPGTAVDWSTVYAGGSSIAISNTTGTLESQPTWSGTISVPSLGANPGPVYVNAQGELYTPRKKGNDMLEFLGCAFLFLLAVGAIGGLIALGFTAFDMYADAHKAKARLADLEARLDDIDAGVAPINKAAVVKVRGVAPHLTAAQARAVIRVM